MRIFIILLFALILVAGGTARADTLHFIVKVPAATPAGAALFVTGASPELCAWRPDCVALNKIGLGVYEAFVSRAGAAAPVAFKVTRGRWATEAADSFGQPAAVFLTAAPPEKDSVVSVVHWKDLPPLGVTGTLEIHAAFHSPQLHNDRALRIWLPPGYGEDASQRYPVIYMHDGQNLFDPATAYSAREWNIDETLQRLILAHAVPPVIVVGVDNTADRFPEYDYNDRGALYADFLVQTVKPFVDANYRTRPDREHTYTMGSSMGGFISFALLWARPEVFSRAAALSLPAHLDNRSAFRLLQNTPPPKLAVKFYQDFGTYGLDAPYPAPGTEFAGDLAGLKPATMDFVAKKFPWADHNEADWSRRAFIPLEFLLR